MSGKWPKIYSDPEFASLVIEEYAQLADLKHALVDICVRSSVYESTYQKGNSEKDMIFLEGRRSLALEIMELARIDPYTLDKILKTRTQEK
jgi:hypothetical protein